MGQRGEESGDWDAMRVTFNLRAGKGRLTLPDQEITRTGPFKSLAGPGKPKSRLSRGTRFGPCFFSRYQFLSMFLAKRCILAENPCIQTQMVTSVPVPFQFALGACLNDAAFSYYRGIHDAPRKSRTRDRIMVSRGSPDPPCEVPGDGFAEHSMTPHLGYRL